MPPIKEFDKENIASLLSNDKAVLDGALDILLRIARNIIKDPKNQKFRSISLSSSVVQNKLLPAAGALECLFDMGFVEGEDNFVFPTDASITKLQSVHDLLEALQKDPHSHNNPPAKVQKISNPVPPLMPKPKIYIPPPSKLTALYGLTQNAFIQRILSNCDRVLQYEDKTLQLHALSCIPLLEINEKVEASIRRIQEAYKDKKLAEENINYQELQLQELITWFKKDFFTWTNSPQCPGCGDSNSIGQGARPSPYSGIDRIEVYECSKCSREILFPRYNDVSRLLVSRTGRCGEWANCFTLLCRSMGWDARLVLDETDHAWTEVYLNLPKTWVHCDPCEGIVGAPLLYEAGWKKKINYVLAYSCEEVQDVTWRYSSNHKSVLSRRNSCTEQQLVDIIVKVRGEYAKGLSLARRKFVLERSLLETVDMLMEHAPTAESLQGRMSGSLAWRAARGELGAFTPYIWKVSKKEAVDGKWEVTYSAATDKYTVKGGQQVPQGWKAGVAEAVNVQRKVEEDWKMAYLARTENSEKAVVRWEFELEPDSALHLINVTFPVKLYESAQAKVTFSSGDISVVLPIDEVAPRIISQAFKGCQRLSITAELSGGKGDIAWQHTQLFRQPLEDPNPHFNTLMRVILHLKPK